MRKHVILLVMLCASFAWGNQITVQMLNIPGNDNLPQPNFYVFNIDGEIWKLLCDQFFPNVFTGPYTAKVATLDDLTGTALIREGFTPAEALQRYQWIAILDLWAYADPSLAPDVTWVNRFLTDTSNPPKNLTPTQLDLLAKVQAANPAAYNLSTFRIFYGLTVETQEQTGHAPEPATIMLTVTALGGFALLRRRLGRGKS